MVPGSEIQAYVLHPSTLGAAGGWEVSGDSAMLGWRTPGSPPLWSHTLSHPPPPEASGPYDSKLHAGQSHIHPAPRSTPGSAQAQAHSTGPGAGGIR